MMWQFLQKNPQARPRLHLWITLLGLSLCLHIFLLGLIFYFNQTSHSPLLINTFDRVPPAIILVPLQKKVPNALQHIAQVSSTTHSVKKPEKVINNSVSSSKSQKPAATPSKTQTIFPASPSSLKKVDPIVSKPITPSVESKKASISKPKVETPKAAEKKLPPTTTNQERSKKALPTPLTKEVNLSATASKHPQSPPFPTVSPPSTFSPVINKIKEKNSSDVIYVGQEDLEHIRLMQEVNVGISNQWTRPAGIATHQSCRLKVMIDSKGAKEIIVDQSSGALIYDVCAKKAVLSYQFPTLLWNREIVLIM